MNTSNKKPSFSIVLAVQDQAEALHSQLPGLLTQQYEDFLVIVVDECSTDDTTDELKRLGNEYGHLYTTFVPKYHFQRDRRRLAFTIGTKATRNEWVIFTDVNTIPSSPTWLEEISEFAVSPNELLLGYVKRKTGDIRLKTFEDIAQARKLIVKTEQRRAFGSKFFTLHSSLFTRDYDFIVVRADRGHELLRLFELSKTRRL